MVKLQKRFAYKYKDKEHYKYVVTIPSDTMGQLDWPPDTDLSVTVSNESIVIKPAEDELVQRPKPKRRGGAH
jgi:hypothetical protein